jgi:predicted transcriptional regulator
MPKLRTPPRGFIVSFHGLVKYSRPRSLAMTTRRLQRRPAVTERPPGGRSGLGPLEAKVLELLWGHDRPLTVRHVHAAFPDLAYTTMMTTLDRLYRKGLLIRCRHGRAFEYESRCSRDELLGEMISGHVTDLLAASVVSTAILSTLVDVVGRRDASLLDELDALVQAKREQLKVGDT